MSREVPEFVIAGHPNEGKSSVLSTLAEDDSVRISPIAGETRECRGFPVIIDGQEIIRFVDTPGFQNPFKTLRWMRDWSGPYNELIPAFIKAHRHLPEFHDDCTLLEPMIHASGIIFVVDGSRPMRKSDRAEMEILRLIGKPRMAVINCKEDETGWLDEWRHEFRRHFNLVRIFNSCRETYQGRIELLESLKGIDQELSPELSTVIRTIKNDWRARKERTSEIFTRLFQDILSYTDEAAIRNQQDRKGVEERLLERYRKFAQRREQDAFSRVRKIYRHNVFNCPMPEPDILKEDIFSEASWEFLGLTGKQLVFAGAVTGAAAGAALDLGHGGLSLGLFSAAGGILGAAGTAFKARKLLSGVRVLGMNLDRHLLRVGPAANIQLLYILIDRALIFYSHITGWAHGRRDYENAEKLGEQAGAQGVTAGWAREKQKVCERFFRYATGKSGGRDAEAEEKFRAMIETCLEP